MITGIIKIVFIYYSQSFAYRQRENHIHMNKCISISVKNMSAGRQEAFDHFRRDNPLNLKLEEHKRILKQRYTEAKTLGEEINHCRNRISNTSFSIFRIDF